MFRTEGEIFENINAHIDVSRIAIWKRSNRISIIQGGHCRKAEIIINSTVCSQVSSIEDDGISHLYLSHKSF